MAKTPARGRKTLTTNEAADLAGISPAAFRSAMVRARKQGVDLRMPGPDQRTPYWDEAGLRRWLASRPGRGWWGPRPQRGS